ncbi:MAG: tyrosine--tRNA ligase [Candidatus Woykebacteria bacterium RIFCSPHIGHO2_12_FULL_45_10]|uniref:Tyrosine--tRNA ligase n=1 Tax=Candidatus Woykebacteria bacterium RIFCSPHIGHO2_12_FULL_45_10 TaxID=1802603 RepID=A0A1G1WQG9_9BACT|nr:MAG: tyrosine--tRNA ligase [Candidatus Woykebacteria bacterium RIFCSPHIGHO2_12_FULL_45_10]
MNPIEHLLTKNVERVYPSRQELEAKLKQKTPLRVYLGVDPSSNKFHLGHAILLKKLAEFQKRGHETILLIGDFTGMIGDPTGKDRGRVPLTREQVLKNAKSYQRQAAKFLSFVGKNKTSIKYNSTWLDKLTLKEIVEIASKFTVQQFLERDMFQLRLKKGQPISLHEFLYPLLQGYDGVAMDVDVEIGGTDQTFNMLIGREMSKGKKVVLTTPLLAGTDGQKMSKIAGNTIAIEAPPAEMFGKIMSIKDELISSYFDFLTVLEPEVLKGYKKSLQNKDYNPMKLKLLLAKEIVNSFYSEKQAQEALQEFQNVIQKGELPTNIPEITLTRPEETLTILELVKLSALAPSNQAAYRLIEQGGVEIDGKIHSLPKKTFEIKQASTMLRVGKRSYLKINWGQKQ